MLFSMRLYTIFFLSLDLKRGGKTEYYFSERFIRLFFIVINTALTETISTDTYFIRDLIEIQ